MSKAEQRRQRLEDARLQRIKAHAAVDTRDPRAVPPLGAVMADPEALRHNNTYGLLPRFYVDQLVECRQCGKQEVWPARRQKWWYEVAKGDINTRAVLCRSCRAIEKARKDQARQVHLEGLARTLEKRKP